MCIWWHVSDCQYDLESTVNVKSEMPTSLTFLTDEIHNETMCVWVMTRNYLDSKYGTWVKGQGQNNQILVVWLVKVRKRAKIRNRYNQVPHLTQDTNGESNKLTIRHHKRKPRGLSFPSRWPQGINKQTRTKTQQTQDRNNIKDPQKSTGAERSVKCFTGGRKPVLRRQPRP